MKIALFGIGAIIFIVAVSVLHRLIKRNDASGKEIPDDRYPLF